MSYITYIFFKIHHLGIYLVPFSWIITPKALILQFTVILSWFLNNNKCIISELEYLLFRRTFMGEGRKYYVPTKHRYILYINFIIGLFYYLICLYYNGQI